MMIKVTRTFWVVLALLVAVTAGYVWTRSSLFLRTTFLGVLLIFVSMVLARVSVTSLRFSRNAREQRLELGKILEERIEISNSGYFRKPWLEVRDGSTFPGTLTSRVLSKIGKHELRNFSSYSLLRQRGNYHLGPTRLAAGDPFGLFKAEVEFASTQSVLVLPYIVELRWFPFPPGYLQGGRVFRQKTLEVTPHAAGVREYAPGDSLNRIHWPTTARRERLMVKEFEKDPQADAWIFLDAQRGTHRCIAERMEKEKEQFWFWKTQQDFKLPEDSFEYAASLAASVAKYWIRNQRAVGFCAAGQRFITLPAERGERQLGKILEILALLDCLGKMPLFALVESQAPHLVKGSTVVLITASAEDQVLLSVDSLIRRSLKPVVILLEPASFDMSGDCPRLVKMIRARAVPCAIVRCDDDLQTSLENGFSQAA